MLNQYFLMWSSLFPELSLIRFWYDGMCVCVWKERERVKKREREICAWLCSLFYWLYSKWAKSLTPDSLSHRFTLICNLSCRERFTKMIKGQQVWIIFGRVQYLVFLWFYLSNVNWKTLIIILLNYNENWL